MSYLTMATNIQGDVPSVARPQAQTAIQEALAKIYQDRSWSFQTAFSGWLPGRVLLNTGTFTVTPYSSTVTADAVATQAINTLTGRPFITELQYRDPARMFYSIVGADNNGEVAYGTTLTPGSGQTPGTYVVNILDNGGSGAGATASITVDSTGAVSNAPEILTAGSGYVNPYIAFSEGGTPATFAFFCYAVLTLDRPWMEPTSGPGQPYMIYQALFAVPVPNFRQFNAMWNSTTAQPLDFSQKSQLDLAREYPQRLVFGDPYYAISWGEDTRPGSATAGYRLYELFPHVLNLEPVSFEYEYDGPLLVNPTDTVPYPLTEDLVKWRSREVLYDWCEANKGKHPELKESNWQYLSGKAHAQYEEILAKITALDANLRTDLIVQGGRPFGYDGQPYSTRIGQVNVGSYPLGE